jgi:flagellar basal-body rod protein FlgF
MNYGLYVSAASLQVNEARQSVIANNLANVNTTSFKRDLAIVRSRLNAPVERGMAAQLTAPVLDRMGGGLRTDGSYTDFSQGPLQQTGNKFDLALDGEGFFVVDDGGQRRYTRDGRLTLDGEGYLSTQAGQKRLLDSAGAPIRLTSREISVDEKGLVRSPGVQARLAVVRFDDPGELVKTGGNLFRSSGQVVEKAGDAHVQQQFIEASGVEPTRALVDMISVGRAYEASAKMIKFADAMLGRAVNDIARIS